MSPLGSSSGGTADLMHSGNVHGAMVGFLGLFLTGLLQSKGYLPPGGLYTIAGGVISFLTGKYIARGIMHGAAAGMVGLTTPSGDTTAYAKTYSNIEALVVRGALDQASDAWDLELAEDPQNPSLRVRVADFHLRTRRDATKALSHYLAARALGSAGFDLSRYIQQKLVDIYLDELKDDGKAMVELRRLIDGFPGTQEAERARGALAELKARRQAT